MTVLYLAVLAVGALILVLGAPTWVYVVSAWRGR